MVAKTRITRTAAHVNGAVLAASGKPVPATPEEVAALLVGMAPPMDAQQFVAKFKEAVANEDKVTNLWLDMAIEAPRTFGENAYIKDSEDYQAMRSHMEAGFGMPDAPERSDKSDAAEKARAARKNISTMLTVYITRMTKYASGLPASAPTTAPTLESWAKRALLAVAGQPVKRDAKGKITQQAKAPLISGIAPPDLIAVLRRLAGDSAEIINLKERAAEAAKEAARLAAEAEAAQQALSQPATPARRAVRAAQAAAHA